MSNKFADLGFEPIEKEDSFEPAFKRTLGFEGGYTVDHAGPTNLGITQSTYDNWRKKQGLPPKPVKMADTNEAKQLYKDEYFDKPGFSKLPTNVAGVLFDYGVNAGTARAAMALQKAVGASPDGVIGPKTLNTVNSFVSKNGEKALLQRIMDDRSKHNNKLITGNPSKFKKFANGWNNRINAIKAEFKLSDLNPFSVSEASASDNEFTDLGFEGAAVDTPQSDFSDLGFVDAIPQLRQGKPSPINDEPMQPTEADFNFFVQNLADKMATTASGQTIPEMIESKNKLEGIIMRAPMLAMAPVAPIASAVVEGLNQAKNLIVSSVKKEQYSPIEIRVLNELLPKETPTAVRIAAMGGEALTDVALLGGLSNLAKQGLLKDTIREIGMKLERAGYGTGQKTINMDVVKEAAKGSTLDLEAERWLKAKLGDIKPKNKIGTTTPESPVAGIPEPTVAPKPATSVEPTPQKTSNPVERAAQHGEVVGIDAKSGLPVIDTSVKPEKTFPEVDRRNSDLIPQPSAPKNRLSDWTPILNAYDDEGKKYQIAKLDVSDAVKAKLLDHYGLLFDKPVEAAQTTTPNLTPKQTVDLAPSTDNIITQQGGDSNGKSQEISKENNEEEVLTTTGVEPEIVGKAPVSPSQFNFEIERSARKAGTNPSKTKDWISATLTNDEVSIDKDLVDYFQQEGGFSKDVAEFIVSKRREVRSLPFGITKESSDVSTPSAGDETANASKPPAIPEVGFHIRDTLVSPEKLRTLPAENVAEILKLKDEFNNLGYIDARTEIGPDQSSRMTSSQINKLNKIREKAFLIEDRVKQLLKTQEELKQEKDISVKEAEDKNLQKLLNRKQQIESFLSKQLSSPRDNITKREYKAINNEIDKLQKPFKANADITKYENKYTDDDKKDIATLTDIEINMPNGEKWTYNLSDSSETQFGGNPSGHSETMQAIGPKESFKLLAMAQEGKPLTALQKKKVDELLADFRANIKPSLERIDNEISKTASELTQSETEEVIRTFEAEEGFNKPTAQEESNITPSGQIRLELLPPEKKELFQEEGELFKGNKGIDASTGGKSIDSFENQTQPTGTQEEFKLFQEVQALAKKWVSSPIGEKYVPKGSRGARFKDNGTILINSMNNLSTMIHEVTHDLSANNTFIKDVMKVKGIAKNGNPIYDTASRPARKELTDIYVKYYPGGKADHALAKRVNEGYSVLAQRMVEAPTLTQKEFPYLYTQVVSEGGKYYDPKFAELISDGQKIVRRYQALSPLQKMGARVLNTGRDIDKKSFLSLSERIVEESADRIYPIEKMAKETGLSGTVDDPSLWARAYNVIRYIALENINTHNGYVTIRNGEFKKIYDFNWKTLLENLHKEGGDKNLEDFSYWLVARRVHYGYERLDVMRKELVALSDAMQDIPKEQLSKEDVKALQDKIKEYNEANAILKSDNINRKLATEAFNSESKRFEKHAEMFDKLVRADLDLLHSEEVQLVNDKRYEKLTNEKGYAPFQRDIFNEIIGTPSDDRPVARSLTGKNKISSMLGRTGSELPIVSPVYGAMMNHLEILKKANRQIIYNIIGEKVASHYPELFREVPIVRAVSDDGRISYPQEKDRNIMMTYSGQKRKAFIVDEEVKALVDELFTFEDRHLLEKALVKASSLFTKGTTGLYPPFAIANFVVDQFTATAQTKNNLVPVISQVKLLYKMLSKMGGKEAQYFKEYLMLGGERQTFVEISELSPEESYRELLKERDLLHKAMALINDGVNILSLPAKYSEIITRGTEYVLARMNGKPQLAALEEAGRVTAPFHHEGRAGGHVGRSYVKSMPYFKARLQVIAQMGRSLLNDKKSRNRALFVIAAITAANVAAFLYLLNNATDEQKENYNALSPRELSGYIFLPDANGHDLTRIRVPEQMNFIANLSNMIIADKFNNAKYKPYDYVNAGTAWLPDQLNVTDPQRQFLSMWPQLMVPAAGLVLNKRTYPEVRDLENQSMKARPPQYRYYENTSKAAIVIGQKLGVSPIKVDFLIEGYLGRSTRFATGKEVSNPLVRKVYLESMRQVENFYDLKQKVDQERKALRDEIRKERYKGEEEYLNILNEDIKDIEGNLKDYRNIKKINRNDPGLKKLRRDILKGINELPRKLK